MMNSLLLALLVLTLATTASASVNCSQYQASHTFSAVPVTLNYVVSTDGIFSAEVVYKGQGYVALGVSPNGRMRGAMAVIGLPDEGSVLKYNLGGYQEADVTLSEDQTLLSGDVQQNETHTVMTFSKYLQEDGEPEIIADTGYNNFIVAVGSDNELGYHEHRTSVGLRVETCVEEDPEAVEEEETGIVDCNEYQSSHSFQGQPLTLNYVVTEDGVLHAQVVYEGQGYVAWGLSPDGRMGNSMAVIGLPDSGSVGKYFMRGYSLNSVALTEEQTLFSEMVEQNDTHTVLEFSKLLQEDGELEIVADGKTPNYFLVAGGNTNELGYHTHRATIGLPLQVCQQGVDESEVADLDLVAVEVKVDNKKSLFMAHGITSAIAWGILAPLALTSAFARHLIPKAGLWYQIHFYSNVMVLVLTIISFALAYAAIQATEGGNHFEASPGTMGKHKTIGLVVTILVVIQAAGGVVRPNRGKEKTTMRMLWEVSHKGSGLALVAMAYYQCHSGLVLYAQRFVQENDYVTVFWVVTGIILGAGVLGKLHKIFVYQEPQAEETDNENNTGKNDLTDNPTEMFGSSRLQTSNHSPKASSEDENSVAA